jgi:predicted kinase
MTATTPTLIITRGLPGSGKTTRALQWIAAQPGRRARVNRDDLRRMLHGRRLGTNAQEAMVTVLQHVGVRAMLERGWDVIADDTNLTQHAIDQWRNLAGQAGATLTVWDHSGVDVDECVRRDAGRDGDARVGGPVIRGLHLQHLVGILPTTVHLAPDQQGDEYRVDIITGPDPDSPSAVVWFRAPTVAAAVTCARIYLDAHDGPDDRYAELLLRRGETAEYLTDVHLGA